MIPGIGTVKAEKLLAEHDPMVWVTAVKRAYEKHFGAYYGQLIYDETAAAISLMTPSHPFWDVEGKGLLEPYIKLFQPVELCQMSL